MHRAPGDDYRLINTLTGLRAYAALWVLARHFFAGKHYDVGIGTAIDLGPLIHIVILTFGFLLGFFLYGLYRQRFLGRISWDAVCVVTLAVFIAMMLLNGSGYRVSFALNFPIGLLVFATACSSGDRKSVV